jgi:hypothetical protein
MGSFIGSEAHKELFCESFLGSHKVYEPAELGWPDLDELSLARLKAIPVWTLALEVELSAGTMLAKYSQTEPDPLVRRALELQGYEEARHGRILTYMIERYGLDVKPNEPPMPPTRRAFVDFGYNECVDSFAGFGIFRLARDARVLPDAFTKVFTQLLVEEARHIVFFVNWIAWDRTRRGLRGPIMQAIPVLIQYASAIIRRIKEGVMMQGNDEEKSGTTSDNTLDLFTDVVSGLTAAKFLRACITENTRYMSEFDPRLLRPRVIPTIAAWALAIIEAIERIRLTLLPAPREAQ